MCACTCRLQLHRAVPHLSNLIPDALASLLAFDNPPITTSAGSDFAGCCFTFDPVRLESGAFTAGSLDGELLAGSFVRPPGDEPPDHTRSLFAPHVGPLVALSPSPFLPELLLTADAWCWRLWAGAGARTPLFASPFADEQYTAGESAVCACMHARTLGMQHGWTCASPAAQSCLHPQPPQRHDTQTNTALLPRLLLVLRSRLEPQPARPAVPHHRCRLPPSVGPA